MSSVRLTPTSYVVLGLIEQAQPATPYDLKQLAQISVAGFWTIPHTQLYNECGRLAEAGLLQETREETGRRRRVFTLASCGRAALDAWRAEPVVELYEFRDPGLMKLFFGGDPATIAPGQLAAHRERLAGYEELRDQMQMPDGPRRALDAGIGHEREFVRFWTTQLEAGDD